MFDVNRNLAVANRACGRRCGVHRTRWRARSVVNEKYWKGNTIIDVRYAYVCCRSVEVVRIVEFVRILSQDNSLVLRTQSQVFLNVWRFFGGTRTACKRPRQHNNRKYKKIRSAWPKRCSGGRVFVADLRRSWTKTKNCDQIWRCLTQPKILRAWRRPPVGWRPPSVVGRVFSLKSGQMLGRLTHVHSVYQLIN